jgi:hypothetical protein
MGLSAGRTVRLFLVDGAATGLMTAEILSFTGRALVAPRSRLPDVLKRQEAKGTGVYFLVGDDPKVAGQHVYTSARVRTSANVFALMIAIKIFGTAFAS